MPLLRSTIKLCTTIKLRPTIFLLMLFWLPQLQAQNLLVLGDSLSAAYGMDEKQGWVQLLRHRLKQQGLDDYRVINASISGETSAGGSTRLPRLMTEYQPAVVILELGGNDGLRGYPINSLKKQLQRSIDISRSHSAQVLLLGMEIPPNYGHRYSRMFRETYLQLARNNGVAVVPFFLDGVATDPQLMQADGLHPKPEGQGKMLENVWPSLLALLQAEPAEP